MTNTVVEILTTPSDHSYQETVKLLLDKIKKENYLISNCYICNEDGEKRIFEIVAFCNSCYERLKDISNKKVDQIKKEQELLRKEELKTKKLEDISVEERKVLLAVINSEKSLSLQEIQFELFTPEIESEKTIAEIEKLVNELIKKEYLKEDSSKYALTEEAREFFYREVLPQSKELKKIFPNIPSLIWKVRCSK
jgi:hypothetical protein